MEATIKTNDKNAFNSLIQILKSMNFEVETKEEKVQQNNKSVKKGIDLNSFSFYQSMEATKGIKGSLSDTVIEERRSE